jgi:multidrug resistance efflux pump
MRRFILIPLLIIVALFAIIGGIGYWVYNNYMYYSTDDASINGNIVNVIAPATGQLASLSVNIGDKVTAGETVGTVTPAVASAATGTGKTVPTSIDLTSPITGTVVQISAVQGQTVAPGLSIMEVTNPNNVNVIAYVDESSISNISTGQSVDISVDAYSGTSFTGHVQQIIPAAASEFSLLPSQDYASSNYTKVGQRIPVIITLDGNGGKALAPGMSAEVTIHLH